MKSILPFLLSLILVHGSALADSEAEKLHWPREALVFVKFMLASSHKTDAEKIQAFDDAYTFLKGYWESSEGTIQPTSLAEYIQYTEGNRELFLDLERELKSYREGYYSRYDIKEASNPDVQAQIRSYRNRQAALAENYLDQALRAAQASSPNTNIRQTVVFQILQNLFSDWNQLRDQTPQLIEKFPLHTIADGTKLQVANAFEGIFSQVQNEIRGLGDVVGRSMATPDIPHVQASIETLFKVYFQQETDAAINNMISGLLDEPGVTDNIERMGIVLQYAAPNLLKLLQLIARQEGISPEALKVLTQLEDAVRGASWYAIRKMIEPEIELMAEQGIIVDLEKVDKKALAAATIGQIHKGFIQLQIPQEAITYNEDTGVLGKETQRGQKEVVFRFTKPGSAKRAEEGRQIMRVVAQALDTHPLLVAAAAPKAEPMVDGLYEGIVNDMDIPGTVYRHQTGIDKYTFEQAVKLENGQTVRIVFKVPHLYYEGKHFTIMEAVGGDKLSSIYEMDPLVGKTIARKMSFKWFSEAFFESGFHHSDLHPGNFMAKAVKDSVISVKKFFVPFRTQQSVPTYVVNILDFGMGGVADFKLRRGVFGMMVAATAFDAELLAEIAWREHLPEISEVKDETEFRARFFAGIAKANETAEDDKARVRLYLNAVSESGISFDPIAAGLMRGAVIKGLVAKTVGDATTFTGFIGRVLYGEPRLLKKLLMSDDLIEPKSRWVAIYDLLRKTRKKVACKLNLASP